MFFLNHTTTPFWGNLKWGNCPGFHRQSTAELDLELRLNPKQLGYMWGQLQVSWNLKLRELWGPPTEKGDYKIKNAELIMSQCIMSMHVTCGPALSGHDSRKVGTMCSGSISRSCSSFGMTSSYLGIQRSNCKSSPHEVCPEGISQVIWKI